MRLAMRINSEALLIELDDGSMHVSYDGTQYARDELVPFHIFGSGSNASRHATAAAFVTTCMHAKFGEDQAQWPALATRFVTAKDTI
jgi:hypothetical protein